MAAYYNEIEPYAAAWLRNLIKEGLIADGEVDERSIVDVRPDDIKGFRQVHFFAGIGVWSYALRLAEWPDDRPVWTGSCPCQPFSAAGKGAGFADERHLWPEFHRLITECRPPVVFGEQVASKDGLQWLDTVQSDMEASGYAIGAADLCAAGIGAPHIRQRLWFVGERLDDTTSARHNGPLAGAEREARDETRLRLSGEGRSADRMGNASNDGLQRGLSGRPDAGRQALDGSAGRDGTDRGLADASGERRDGQQVRIQSREQGQAGVEIAGHGGLDGLEHASSLGRQRRQTTAPGHDDDGPTPRRAEGQHGSGLAGSYRLSQNGTRPTNGHWRDADWLHCRDGKWRPVEPGTFPLAHGASSRVGRLRAYGNAIVPQAAAEVIGAYMDARAQNA